MHRALDHLCWITAVAAAAFSAAASAQQASLETDPADSAASEVPGMSYTIAFPNRVHHEAEVELRVQGVDPSQPMDLRMSRSSPGRYRLHEFARNVYQVSATDSTGRSLEVLRSDLHGWTIPSHQGSAVIAYTVFGDHVSGTYSAVDETHAHLNPPSVFAWVKGLENRPIELRIELPDPSWAIATQLQPTEDPQRFRAQDLWAFMDSPIEASDFVDRRWQMADSQGTQEFRMTFHHQGTARDIDSYVNATKRLVSEAVGVFGELPRFDHGRYTFMVDYLPWATGDAMEHRNSTPLTSNGSIAEDSEILLETLVHEFFHAWNVERLRPASLEPFDFEQQTFSPDLWFAEGFTNYYDGLLLHRAGIWSQEQYLADLSRTVQAIMLSPAPRFASPVGMSQHAAFRDRADWRDPQNSTNTYLHYYIYGDAIALALDLELRARGTDLDQLMRLLWESHGRSELPYTQADLQAALAQTTDATFAESFFDDYIRAGRVPDYESLLRLAGLTLQPEGGRSNWLGQATLEEAAEGLLVTSATRIDTPLYRAGVDRGDVLLELDGRSLRKVAGLERQVQRAKPGDSLRLLIRSRAGLRETTLVVEENRQRDVVPIEDTRAEVTLVQQRFRQQWLGSVVGTRPQ